LIPTAKIFGLFTYSCFVLKGIVSRDEYLFNVLEIKLELSIYALKVLQKFWKLADEKVTSKFLLASLKLLTNSENQFSNHHHRPYRSDFDPDNAYRKPPVILLRLLYLLYTGENRPITEKQRQKRPMAEKKSYGADIIQSWNF
jgi:hypothetical protein